MNLTTEQRLQKAALAIMAHTEYEAMAGVFLMGTKRVERDAAKCPTAYTNGLDEVYGGDFVDSLTDPELRFLMIHECKHKMRRDLLIYQHLHKTNAQVANMAMDFVINIEIVDAHKGDGFATMTGPLAKGCFDKKYRGWGTVRVFNDLMQGAKDNPGGGGSSGNPTPQGTGSQVLDDHGWGEAENMTEAEKQDLQQTIDSALRQGAVAAGALGKRLPREMEELLKPQVDWRAALREFVTTMCSGRDYSSWRRPNRRYIGAGILMPGAVSEKIDSLVTAADMSGSIGIREQTLILSEVAAVAEQVKPDRLDMIYWHTEVSRHETYEMHEVADFIKSTKPDGCGGTDVRCVPAFMRKEGIKPQAAIVLTDGHLYSGWGDWDCPVLWVIIDNPDAVPTTGTAVHIDSSAL